MQSLLYGVSIALGMFALIALLPYVSAARDAARRARGEQVPQSKEKTLLAFVGVIACVVLAVLSAAAFILGYLLF